AMQACTFSGPSGVCVEIATNPNTVQTCTFNKGSPPPTTARSNFAIVVQIIVQRNGGPVVTQNGLQLANVQQQNTTKPNLSFVVQIRKQSAGRGSDNYDSEVSDYAPVESSAESQGVLPNWAPLISKLETAERSQEGPETVAPTSPGPDVDLTQQSQQTVNVCQGG